MSVATYCRVSTDNQESEGTSLQTQLEACLDYCQQKGYEVSHRFSEAYSGLTLDRPKLNELRELVRNEQIDAVIIYSLDRLSRNATHGVILRDEFEKHHIILESATEDIEKGPLGEAITYLRGTFSQIEAEKIKERTMRGKRARAREGRIPSGGGTNIYGYDYIKVSQDNGGRRVINDIEASWVKQIYQWLVDEGLSTNAITYRLRALNAPSKVGNVWNRRSVQKILKNPSYTGRTFVFTTIKGGAQFSRPQEDWVEIAGVTPAVISQELFGQAQKQLGVNKQKTVQNTKHQYLLRGHLKCHSCWRSYAGTITVSIYNGKRYIHRHYRCMGKLKIHTPVGRCCNKGWSANKLEGIVWAELERYLSNPELIVSQLEAQRQNADQVSVFEAELERIERHLKAVGREQHQLLRWALQDFPAEQVEAENKRLNKAKETLTAQRSELENQLKAGQEAVINVPNLESLIERIQAGITTLDFEGKRQVLDMLGITIYLDGENVEISGVIDPEAYQLCCVSNQEGGTYQKKNPAPEVELPLPVPVIGGHGIRLL
ncbi:recombinase family protein [Chloroflexota bacterium]